MPDIPREKLIELIARFGPQLSEDPKRCEGLLRDLCGEHKREIVLLVAAIREGVTTELRGSQGAVPKNVLVERCVQRMHAHLGVTLDLARWSVESWAIALGENKPLLLGTTRTPKRDPLGRHCRQPFRSPCKGTTRTPKRDPLGRHIASLNANITPPIMGKMVADPQFGTLNDPIQTPSGDPRELLRESLREILADGVITEDEKTRIRKLRETLHISIEDAQSIFAQVKAETMPNSVHSPTEVVNSIGMKLKLIPAGSFVMGGGGWFETPHTAIISRSFYLGVFQVTQEEYERVMKINPSYFNGSRNPVECISWDDAVEFCRRLSELPAEKSAGRIYRLPTEAEWEYACRAGSTTEYCFGDDDLMLGEYAWFLNNSDGKTHPVGQKKPNALGLHDMHGNLWEWCADWYGEYSNGAVTDPQGAEEGSGRVNRGGGWGDDPINCRSAIRSVLVSSSRFNGVGLRLALSPFSQVAARPGVGGPSDEHRIFQWIQKNWSILRGVLKGK